MKKTKYIIALGVLFAFSCALVMPLTAYAGEKTELSIQEALDIAYKSNPDLRKAQLEVDKAQILRDDLSDAVTWIPTGGLVAPGYQQLYNGYQQAEIGLKTAKKANKAEKDRITKEVIAAYSNAIKNYNTMETIRLQLEDMKEQQKITSLGKEVGYVSEHDYGKFKTGLKGLEEGYKATQAQYDSSIATLRSLLGRSQLWEPELTSRATLSGYERHELSVETSRALTESIMVLRQQALLDVEQSKQEWVLPNISSDMQNITLNMAEIDYEQAKRTARSTIEALYHGIDALEGQIEAKDAALQTAEKDLEVAQIKYDLGMIPRQALTPGAESLAAAELQAEKTRLELESLKADLVQTKATFAYLTGQTVYDPVEW